MKDFKFEESVEELQGIVDKLEKGDLTLDESVDLFKKGVELSKLCTKKLDEVEKKITILTEDGEEDNKGNEQIFEIAGD